MKTPGLFGPGDGDFPFEMEVISRDLLDVGPRGERVDERSGRRRGAMDEDLHPAGNLPHRLIGVYRPLFPVVSHRGRSYVIPSEVEGPGRSGGAPPTPPGPSTS